MDSSTNFFHWWWQTKAAESLGIARLNTDAIKSPDLFICKQRQITIWVFLSMDIELVSVIVVSAFPDCLGRYLWKRKVYLALDPHKLHLYYQELWARNSWSKVVSHFYSEIYARKSCRERCEVISFKYFISIYKNTQNTYLYYLSLKNIVSPLRVVTASRIRLGSQALGVVGISGSGRVGVLSLFGPEGNTTC